MAGARRIGGTVTVIGREQVAIWSPLSHPHGRVEHAAGQERVRRVRVGRELRRPRTTRGTRRSPCLRSGRSAKSTRRGASPLRGVACARDDERGRRPGRSGPVARSGGVVAGGLVTGTVRRGGGRRVVVVGRQDRAAADQRGRGDARGDDAGRDARPPRNAGGAATGRPRRGRSRTGARREACSCSPASLATTTGAYSARAAGPRALHVQVVEDLLVDERLARPGQDARVAGRRPRSSRRSTRWRASRAGSTPGRFSVSSAGAKQAFIFGYLPATMHPISSCSMVTPWARTAAGSEQGEDERALRTTTLGVKVPSNFRCRMDLRNRTPYPRARQSGV